MNFYQKNLFSDEVEYIGKIDIDKNGRFQINRIKKTTKKMGAMLNKLKEKIIKSILISSVCFIISSTSFAYDEFTEKKYKTFDGKIFEIKDDAILHEKVQKKVDLLLEVFRKDIEEFQQQTSDKIKIIATLPEYEYFYIDKLREKKNLYEKYENCFYECIKSLEEKGIEVEIKLSKKNWK